MGMVSMALYDNLKIASYAAAAAALDKSKDLFEGFLPLVETALSSSDGRKPVSFLGLQQWINEIHGVKIPKDTLRYLIDILEKQGKVEFDHKKMIYPSKDWQSGAASLLAEHNAAINVLFKKFQEYLSQRDCSVSISDIRGQVCRWIYLHSSELAKFIASGADKSLVQVQENTDWEHAGHLIAFLVECYKKHSNMYRTFIGLYDGAVQASLLNFTPKELSSVANREFVVKNAVLDTNFILRLLGLQSPLDNEVALSTFQSLREIDVNFCVLPQTIEETCSSIGGFLRETEPVAQQVAAFLPNTSIATSGFWSAFQAGVSRTDFFEWTNPDNVIRELAERFSVVIIDEYEATTIEMDQVNDLIRYKDVDKYAENQAKHDLTLIAYCQSRRPKRPRPLGEEEWWVLTNDAKLAQWERRNSKTQVCMTEVQVSNLLWLFTKKDGGEGLTNTIVSLAGRDALSGVEISAFSEHMEKYSRRYSADPRRLGDLSNVLARAAFSTNDVKTGGASDEDFLSVVDKRAKEIRLQQRLEAQENEKRTEGQAQEIAALRQEIELEKLQSRRRQKENDISATQKSISRIQESISQVEDLKAFCDKENVCSARLVLWRFVVVAILVVAGMLVAYKPLTAVLAEYSTLAENVANFTGFGIVGVAVFLLYYFFVILFFSAPYSPKELFYELQRRNLQAKRERYVIEHRFHSGFAQGLLDEHLASLKDELEQEKNCLASNEKDLEGINININSLQCQAG